MTTVPLQEGPAPSTAGKRDALLLSIGTVGSGVLAYAFNVLAARALGPEAFAAIGGALAPLFSRRRSALRRLEGAQGDGYPMAEAVRFALPAGVIAGCEQILVSGGPLLILIADGEGAAAAAGVLFAATVWEATKSNGSASASRIAPSARSTSP